MIPPYQETKSYKKGDLISWNGHLLQAKVDLTRANPSIDGAIIKKDPTVAENLMLLDTQINNLKQEVEQLKNKQ